MLKRTHYLILLTCVITILYIANYQRDQWFNWVVVIPTLYIIYSLFIHLKLLLFRGYSYIITKKNKFIRK